MRNSPLVARASNASAVEPKMTQSHPPLALFARDSEDLDVLSSLLENSQLRVADCRLFNAVRTLALGLRRRVNEASVEEDSETIWRTCGLRFLNVRQVKVTGFSADDQDRCLELVALRYAAGDQTPEGSLRLIFTEGACMVVDVEALEVELRDLKPALPT